MTSGTVVAIILLVAVAAWGLQHWVNTAKPPPPNLRCANCPKLAVRIRMHKVGHVASAVLLVAALLWGAAGRMNQ